MVSHFVMTISLVSTRLFALLLQQSQIVLFYHPKNCNILFHMATNKKKQMKQLFTFLFTSVSLFTLSQKKQSLLWEVSGNGLSKPSYIFGTFHIMCKDDFKLSDTLKQKIKATEQFYGELDMDDPNMQTAMIPFMQLKDKTLKELMGEADFEKANTAFTKIAGMPLTALNNFKPMMAMSMLMIKSTACNVQNQVQPETALMNIAKETNSPVLGLETVADQMAALDMQPLEEQVRDMKKVILNFDSAKQVFAEMTKVYLKNDVDALYSFVKTYTNNSNSKEFEQAILNKRNKSWISPIQNAMTLKPTFFAVGAGHLGGKEGVLNLLRKQGYTLTPIAY